MAKVGAGHERGDASGLCLRLVCEEKGETEVANAEKDEECHEKSEEEAWCTRNALWRSQGLAKERRERDSEGLVLRLSASKCSKRTLRNPLNPLRTRGMGVSGLS